MPWSPKKPCCWPGCGTLTDGRYCAAHARGDRQAQDRERGSAASRGYDARWRKARAAYLAQHPLCVECARQGQVTAATVVDHILPHKGDDRLFWHPANWQALCKTCHDTKTATEDGGFANLPTTG